MPQKRHPNGGPRSSWHVAVPLVVIVAAMGVPRSACDSVNVGHEGVTARERAGDPRVQGGEGRRSGAARGLGDGRVPVEQTGAPFVVLARCADVVRGALDVGLHLRGRPRRLLAHDEQCRAGDERRRHRCAALGDVAVRGPRLRRGDVDPGRDHVRLDPAVGRRAAARERRQVRPALRSRPARRRADRDRVVGRAGRRDRACDIAAVAGRGDHDLVLVLDRRVDRERDRVLPVGGNVRSQAHRDHVHARPGRAPLDPEDGEGVITGAVRIEHLRDRQAGAGRDAVVRGGASIRRCRHLRRSTPRACRVRCRHRRARSGCWW